MEFGNAYDFLKTVIVVQISLPFKSLIFSIQMNQVVSQGFKAGGFYQSAFPSVGQEYLTHTT